MNSTLLNYISLITALFPNTHFETPQIAPQEITELNQIFNKIETKKNLGLVSKINLKNLKYP